MIAGHNALLGSGPDQKPAFDFAPTSMAFRAGGGAVHSVKSGHSQPTSPQRLLRGGYAAWGRTGGHN